MLKGFTISSAAVRCSDHGGEQSREELFEVDAAAARSCGSARPSGEADDCIMPHLEMVRMLLGSAAGESGASRLTLAMELAGDLDADCVAQRVEHARQLDVLHPRDALAFSCLET